MNKIIKKIKDKYQPLLLIISYFLLAFLGISLLSCKDCFEKVFPIVSRKKLPIILQEESNKLKYDLTGDGKINIDDTALLIPHLGEKNKKYDFNEDGIVNEIDVQILRENSL